MLLSKYKNLEKNMIFGGNDIKSSDTFKLLGITLDRNINFQRQRKNISCKANNKTKSFFCIRKLLNLEQTQILAET